MWPIFSVTICLEYLIRIYNTKTLRLKMHYSRTVAGVSGRGSGGTTTIAEEYSKMTRETLARISLF
jgi:hypothetical protein